MEFDGYGKAFITSHGISPDAFVQMAFQAAYFGLYGRIECVYEPAMTKSFLHGRTEAIRSVQPESVEFTKVCVCCCWFCLCLAVIQRGFVDILFRCVCGTEDRCFAQGVRATRPVDQGVQSRTRTRSVMSALFFTVCTD